MQLNKMILLIVVGLFSFCASAKAGKLQNFVPGDYDLVDGTEDACGAGPLEIHDQTVAIGPYHNFDVENKFEKIPADVPPLSGCIYDVKFGREVKDKTTILTYEDVLHCKDVERHTLTKRAEITKDRVTVDVVQKGNPTFGDDEPSYGFRCIWKLHSAATTPK